MQIRLYSDSDHVWTGALSEFLADNELEGDEAENIGQDLRRYGAHAGGGGAAPEYRLEAVNSQPGERA